MSTVPAPRRWPRWPDWPRPTVRVKLTALYGGMFFLAGLVLVALTYLLMQASLDRRPGIGAQIQVPSPTALPGGGLPLGQTFLRSADGETVSPAELFERIRQAELAERRNTLNDLLTWSLLALGLVGVGATGFGWLMAGRVLRPVHEITATARRVADRSLHERIDLQGPQDELKELADTFDAMLARLDSAFAGQRRFVADASHELRTPLAVNRALLEVALADPDASDDLRRLATNLLTTTERNEQLIEGLLLLAQSGNELTERRPVDLDEIARHVLALVEHEATEAGIALRAALDPMPASGDPILLERVVLNLVQNGIRHNEPGGWVSVTTGANGLVVGNTGPVVPGYEVDSLFEPFRRLPPQRAGEQRGIGLGLSIVRSIVIAHCGSATIAPRPGGGLVVTVRLEAT
ncbi:MAG TPA: ATP-binding protein [Actinomycetes bacterium]|nr:ATP-binding protein [Actinomycetes bacterium]